MKKLIITEEEKKLILEKYFQKSLLIEQKQYLTKLFGAGTDDIFKTVGDDAVKTLDDLFAKVFTKPENLILKFGQSYLRSASGAEIPMKTIRDAVEMVAKGKLQPNQVLTYLPRNLADGTEFRNVFQQAMESKGAQKVVSKSINNLPIGKLGQDFKKLASEMDGFIQITAPKGNMSGWKFHVYADTLDEVAFLYEKILPFANKYGAAFKVGSQGTLERLAKNTLQKGKGVTIYLPPEVISKNLQKEFLSDLQSAIKGYEKSGQISGDRMITNNIGYRYELSKPINTSKGIDMNQYRGLYTSNEGGPHNITGNPDIFYQ